jgi:peptide deformylase
MARCLEHEVDHLDGVVFLRRLERDTRRAAMRTVRESEWFNR